MKKVEFPNVLEEWRKLKTLVDRKIGRFGVIDEEEINEMVQKFRHAKKRYSN